MSTENTESQVETSISKFGERIIGTSHAMKNSIIEAEFDKMMTIGLAQAKADNSLTVEKAFLNLRMEIAK